MPMACMHGFTINVAYASFEEDIKGAIEVGKLATLQFFFTISSRYLAIKQKMLKCS